ncbi:MAG: DNA starvation/stationary phase protection protein Dps, partial [Microcystis panniformis]
MVATPVKSKTTGQYYTTRIDLGLDIRKAMVEILSQTLA